MTARRTRAIDLAVAGLAGVLAFAIYVRSLAPGLLWGDSAEFQLAAWLGGFVHPTGYPLYLMLGWLWTHVIPVGNPAFRMNLFSALCGGLAVMLLGLLLMRLTRFLVTPLEAAGIASSRLVAFGAALAFTFTPTFWSQAVIAEVYTLHAAFVSAALLGLVAWGERVLDGDSRGASRLSYVVALLFGLSLAHHRSTILLIPAAALFVLIVVLSRRYRPRFAMRHAALFLLCLLAPLLLYLYIPLRAPHVPYYRVPLSASSSLPLYDSTLAGFLAHISGSSFSSSLAGPQNAVTDLGLLAGRFVNEVSPNGLFLGILGFLSLIFGVVWERSRRALAVLTLTCAFFIIQVAFNLFYAIGDIHVFYIPAYLVWVLWIALGAWTLVRAGAWLFTGQGVRAQKNGSIAAAILVAVALAAFAYRAAVVYWPKVQRAGDDSARRAWDALLEANLPQGSILLSNDRDEMVPLWYLSNVEGRRPDITGLFPLIQPGPAWSSVGAVTDSALQTGRPVYLVKSMPGLEIKYDLASTTGEATGPLGPAVRVNSVQSRLPAETTDVVYGDSVRLIGYDLTPEPLLRGQSAQVALYWQPLREMQDDWTTFVQIIDSSDNKAGQSDHHPGGVFYPTSQWTVGERLRDVHTFSINAAVAPGPRFLVVGLYVSDGNGLRQLGEPTTVGEVLVSE